MSEARLEKAELREEKEVKEMLHPIVREWFFSRFEKFSMPQLYGVMPIHERKNILISAPTGGTKTLTAFLSILNYLVSLAEKNELEDKVYAVYVSPLKALSNDIHVNLTNPLKEMEEIAEKKGIKMQKIRVGLRTGDTSTEERSRQTQKAPHILVTTPETLAIVLNAPKFSLSLNACEFLIVDEIHALANKRGVHLSLSVERLQNENIMEMTRIGLSATISPLDEIAKFLTGNRDCLIADVQYLKKTDIKVLMPVGNLIIQSVKKLDEKQ
ncbi:MAG: DEAD/DEAH box helicase, partial [Nanoarchaeota archaeon]